MKLRNQSCQLILGHYRHYICSKAWNFFSKAENFISPYRNFIPNVQRHYLIALKMKMHYRSAIYKKTENRKARLYACSSSWSAK